MNDQKLIKDLIEALKFTLAAAEYVYDRELVDGLSPFFYHTLSYEGDKELKNRTIEIRKMITELELK